MVEEGWAKYVETRCAWGGCDGEVGWEWRENRRGTDEWSCAEVTTETTFLNFADSTAGRDISWVAWVGRQGAKE
jgi:hypothetical protein